MSNNPPTVPLPFLSVLSRLLYKGALLLLSHPALLRVGSAALTPKFASSKSSAALYGGMEKRESAAGRALVVCQMGGLVGAESAGGSCLTSMVRCLWTLPSSAASATRLVDACSKIAHPLLRSGARRRVESAARSMPRDCQPSGGVESTGAISRERDRDLSIDPTAYQHETQCRPHHFDGKDHDCKTASEEQHACRF